MCLNATPGTHASHTSHKHIYLQLPLSVGFRGKQEGQPRYTRGSILRAYHFAHLSGGNISCVGFFDPPGIVILILVCFFLIRCPFCCPNTIFSPGFMRGSPRVTPSVSGGQGVQRAGRFGAALRERGEGPHGAGRKGGGRGAGGPKEGTPPTSLFGYGSKLNHQRTAGFSPTWVPFGGLLHF